MENFFYKAVGQRIFCCGFKKGADSQIRILLDSNGIQLWSNFDRPKNHDDLR